MKIGIINPGVVFFNLVEPEFINNLGKEREEETSDSGRVFWIDVSSMCVYLEVIEVIWSRREAQTVDALAVRGDEGRGILRKAMGSWKRALIHRCPNGGTRLYVSTVIYD